MTAAIWYQAAILLLLLHCAWTDLTTFRIGNNSVLALLAVVGLFWLAGLRELHLTDLVLAGGIFIAGFALWMLRFMGGGDVKLLAATMLAIGSESAPVFAFVLLACGIVLGAFAKYWMIVDLYVPLPSQIRTAMSKRRVPYAVCIAVAAVAAMASGWK